jgi:NADH-quinone oxidoreductase subunit J
MSLLFIVTATIAIVSALAVVLFRKPIYSILSLIICLYALGANYILMHAEFLAIVHLIVYAGAIMVLFLFVVMLMNLNHEGPVFRHRFTQLISVIIGSSLAMVIIAAISKTQSMGMPTSSVSTAQIGTVLFTDYLLPFELSTILFLASVVGVVITGKETR